MIRSTHIIINLFFLEVLKILSDDRISGKDKNELFRNLLEKIGNIYKVKGKSLKRFRNKKY